MRLPLGSEGAVAVHVRHIREKIEINPSEPRYLQVVWGQGYKIAKRGDSVTVPRRCFAVSPEEFTAYRRGLRI